MKGVAIVLFASRTNEVSIDSKIPDKDGRYINIGTDNFIKIIDQCREEKKFGLEFIEKYPDSCKAIYSDLTMKEIKALKITIFNEKYQEEEKKEGK